MLNKNILEIDNMNYDRVSRMIDELNRAYHDNLIEVNDIRLFDAVLSPLYEAQAVLIKDKVKEIEEREAQDASN